MTVYQKIQQSRIPLYQKMWISEVYQYVLEKVTDTNLSVSDMAYDFSLSERQLQRHIRSRIGLSPIEFIRAVKLEQAKVLLENGQCQTVQETAYAVGFNRSDYFSGLFKNRFGKKPIAYLKFANNSSMADL
ncbi:helix-turn-helix domain-containing protein [Lewinella cohaerens]|uniref:helix-turn-helix domain-containing protein n=1 Tax=Lewinella cohaerens TaxID=70995 RepID=UPI0003A8106B|nr:helix-turn-helix domain-containing protein [Lewinella cohaerens]